MNIVRDGPTRLNFEVVENQTSLDSPDIHVINVKGAVGEAQIFSHDSHIISVSPPIYIVVPSSINNGKMVDHEWDANTVGLLPVGTSLRAAIMQKLNTSHVIVSDSFFNSILDETSCVNHINVRYMHGRADRHAEKLIRAMGVIAESGNIASWPLLIDAMATSLVARIQNLLEPGSHAPETDNRRISSERLKRVIQFIHANLDTEIRLSDLSRIAGLSPFYFTRAFKRAIGKTPLKYVWEVRIEHAKVLLKRKEMSIAMVAYECGFSNQSHFTTMFKKVTGMTPARFKG